MSQNTLSISANVNKLEELPQPIVAYGRDLSRGDVLPFHSHQRAQFIYASHGVMTVITRMASYVVPPQRAVWMPEGIKHSIKARSDVAMRTLYIDSLSALNLPGEVCVLQVSSLLRELIITAVSTGSDYKDDSPQARIMAVILDQINPQPVTEFALPMPTDKRLTYITESLVNNPADSRNLEEWGDKVGASKRTLSRLFLQQTGISFRDWRQQRRLLRALELLAEGEKITFIALEVGYENTSAFISMFRRCLGTTPNIYLKML